MSIQHGLAPNGEGLTARQRARLEKELALPGKVCKICKVWRPIEDFFFRKECLSHAPHCSFCVNARVRKKRAERICPLTRNIWKECRLRYHAGQRLMIWLAIKEGLSYAQLHRRFGVSDGVLRGLVERWGLPRPRRASRKANRVISSAKLAEIHRLIKQGWTYKAIGLRLGYSRSAIASYIYNYMLKDLPYPLPDGRDYATWKRLGLAGPRPASGRVPLIPGRDPSAISGDAHGPDPEAKEAA